MIAKTITYTDFADNEVTETVYFHLTKTVLLDNLDLKPEVEALAEKFAGAPRDLNSDEVREIMELIKKLMRLSYGVRSEDGRKFRQSDELWDDFKDSAAFDAVLWSLFENPNDAISFMAAIMPKDLMQAAEQEQAKRAVPQDRLPKAESPKAVTEAQSIHFADEDVEDVPSPYLAEAEGEPEESIEELEARLAARRAAALAPQSDTE